MAFNPHTVGSKVYFNICIEKKQLELATNKKKR